MRIASTATWAIALSSLSLSYAAEPPRVNITNGTVVGSTSGSVDTFLGIPFAQPPVGSLRFRPPLAVNTSFGVLNATETPRACTQLRTNLDPKIISQVPPTDIAPYLSIADPPTVVGEDCLTLNVQRPSSAAAAAGSKLPVLFWFYGGSFNTGSTQANDFAALVEASDALGHPILVVQANYRVSAFGFLGGAQVRAEGVGAANVGLRDQRLALQWAADNIAAFGGDPDRVTIWGESAGAVSVLYHMLIEGGDNTYKGKPLFRGAIMNSGSSIPVEAVDGAAAQAVFDAVAEAGGCSAQDALDSLECLRELPYEDLVDATDAAPSLLTYDGLAFSFPPRPDPSDPFVRESPEKAIRAGRIARVPIITGNQADEGTFFGLALYNGTTAETLINRHLGSFYAGGPPRRVLEGLVATYSTDPAEGAPFGTGDANQLYPGFKRNAAVVGDAVFVMQRRHQLEHTADLAPAWSFLANYDHTAGTLGTGHGTDLVMLATGAPAVPYEHVLRYYVSFVNFLDPNQMMEMAGGSQAAPLTRWPRWTPQDRRMIQFNVDGESIIRDDFREQSYAYFKEVISELKV